MSGRTTIRMPGGLELNCWMLHGTGDGPHAYLQAGLHADEIPGMLVLHKLLPRLLADQAAGRLRGRVTIVPQCNPAGLRQFDHGRLLGRFDRVTGQNFNRGFSPNGRRPGAVHDWQRRLLSLAASADIVLDLHTDDEALPYLYVHRALWPAAQDLAACLGVELAITWADGGGGAFEDAIVQRWQDGGRIAGKLCATVELRGQADVDDTTAQADADGLHRLLQARGVIEGTPGMPGWSGETVPIECVEAIRAQADGVVVFTSRLGDRLASGAPFARLVAEPGEPASDLVLRAPQAGRLFTRMRDRYVAAGAVVAKLTGATASPGWSDRPVDD